jgi:hypothetical protein
MGTGRIDHGRLDNLRRGRGPVQEHVIDEFLAGHLSGGTSFAAAR